MACPTYWIMILLISDTPIHARGQVAWAATENATAYSN